MTETTGNNNGFGNIALPSVNLTGQSAAAIDSAMAMIPSSSFMGQCSAKHFDVINSYLGRDDGLGRGNGVCR